MRILHLSTENSWRGGEQQLIYLHEYLLSENIDSLVLAKSDSPVHKYLKDRNSSVVDFQFSSQYDISAALKIKKICRQRQIDLVHIHTSKGHTMAVLAALLGNKPAIILSRRVDFPVKDNWFSRFKYNCSKIAKIVCVSDAIKKVMLPDIKDKDRLVTVHSGIDLYKFDNIQSSNFLRSKFNLDPSAVLIGNTSALADHKDYFTFVDVAVSVKVQNSNAYFFIIGDGPLKREIESYIQKKHARDYIFMTGFLDNVKEALLSLNLFLFTSKTEGLGTSVLDAMCAGIPIVATKAGGVPEMIEDGTNGFLCTVADSDCLKEKVLQTISDEELSQRFTSNSRKKVKRFSKEETARKTISIYQDVLDRSN